MIRLRWLSTSLLVLGCGATPSGEDACTGVELRHVPSSENAHVASCSDSTCGNAENPPTGGRHCGTVLGCRAHTLAQARCSWIHNIEHGHVALLYNCPAGCDAIVETLKALRLEAKTGTNTVARALVTPDPQLPTRVAAVVWGFSWSGDAVDERAIRCLMTKADAEAPEPNLACGP